MKTSAFDQLENRYDSFATSHPIFRTVILFEDAAVLQRARLLHEHLFREAKDRCRLETFDWKLKKLADLEELVGAVTMSDMIIVAGCADSNLSSEIQTALKIGLGERPSGIGALVALLGSSAPDQNPSALHLLLQQLASEAGLKFFPGTFELESFARRTVFKRSAPQSGIDYGINE